jgi:polar amino acid transport system substrate-binding protein
VGRRTIVVIIAGAAALALAAGGASGVTLSALRENGALTVCGHPDALPFSAQGQARPGFQLEIADLLTKRLGARLYVNWIVYARHARRASCDAVMGAIVQPGAPAEGRGGTRLTRPYMGSGYLLVVPGGRTEIRRLEDVKAGKIGVEHTSWPHFVLSQRAIPTSSYGSQPEILDAVSGDAVAAGFVTGPYVGWYLKQHPGSVRVVETASPDPEFQWNVAVRLLNTDQALVDVMNQLIDELVSAGTIPKILESYGIRYVAPHPEPQRRPQ